MLGQGAILRCGSPGSLKYNALAELQVIERKGEWVAIVVQQLTAENTVEGGRFCTSN